MSDSSQQVETRTAVATLFGLVGLVCLAIGVAIIASGGWATIVVGAVLTGWAMLLVWTQHKKEVDLWHAK